jgi:hypothetical protein
MEQRLEVNFCVQLLKPPSEMMEALETIYIESPSQKSHEYESPTSEH